MIRVQNRGLVYYRFESFDHPRIIQGVSTRLGGISRGPFASLNVGHTVGDDPDDVEANHERLYRAFNTCAEAVVSARQVHGDRVAVITATDGGRVLADTDGLISDVPGLLLMLRFADCVPVFLCAPQRGVVGVAHAGWQGTLGGVAAKTARAMMATYGCQPSELLAGLGPAIGPCCFKVGSDVLDPLRARYGKSSGFISRPQPDGKAFVDLWRVNARQLQEIGVTRIEMAGICTCCHGDEFFSFRGARGHTGRFGALIGLGEPD